jgi:hypothetical protein
LTTTTTRTCPTLTITPDTTIRQLSDALTFAHNLHHDDPRTLAQLFRDLADAVDPGPRVARGLRSGT